MKRSHPTRVLVAGDEYYAVLAAVRGLRRGGYEPWLACESPRTPAARSRTIAGFLAVPDPEHGIELFVGRLAKYAARIGASVVLPAGERALLALAGRGDDFPAGTILAAPDEEAAARATDKAVLAGLAAEAGLASPPGATLDLPGAAAAASGLCYPFVLKPARSTIVAGGRTVDMPKARRIESPEALAAAVEEVPAGRWLAQSFVRGSLIAISGLAWRGEPVSTLHQVTLRSHPPEFGVSVYGQTIPRDGELEAGFARLCRLLGWSGLIQAQFLRTGDVSYLIDLNPRVFGSLALSIRAGANLPALWVDLLLGRPPRPAGYRPGVRYRAEPREALAIARLLRERRLREAAAAMAPRRRTAHALFSWRDPRPMLVLFDSVRRRAGEGTRMRRGRTKTPELA